MWTVIYVTKNKATANRLVAELESLGLLAKLHILDEENEKNASVEILVPESEVEKAHAIIIDLDF